MSAVKPRLAVGYHIWPNPEYFNEVIETVSRTYDGPFVQATDLTVINVTDDDIVVREAIVSEMALPTGTTEGYLKAYRSKVDADSKISQFIAGGRWEGFEPPPLPERR
jgi:ribonuclease Z